MLCLTTSFRQLVCLLNAPWLDVLILPYPPFRPRSHNPSTHSGSHINRRLSIVDPPLLIPMHYPHLSPFSRSRPVKDILLRVFSELGALVFSLIAAFILSTFLAGLIAVGCGCGPEYLPHDRELWCLEASVDVPEGCKRE